ncbi:MAG: hypothetical protein SGPRY_006977 [Prymnesium sp.]
MCASLSTRDEMLFQSALQPNRFVVRVYVLRAMDLVPADEHSAPDPYLRVSLGGEERVTRERSLDNTVNPRFHQLFELHTVLPGNSLLRVDVMDRDDFGGLVDDLIGSTEIDLEDRVFSKMWSEKMKMKPPVEQRPLFSPLSSLPQGTLELWVDILSKEEAVSSPPIDISPPPDQNWELRIICWKARDVPTNADDSGMLDLATTCTFGNERPRETDCHLRAQNGAASWNWRFKYPVKLTPWDDTDELQQMVQLQLYDKDIFTAHDCIGDARLSLNPWFRRLFRSSGGEPTAAYLRESPRADEGLEKFADLFERAMSDGVKVVDQTPVASNEDHPYKFWVPLFNSYQEPCGELLLSVQMVPGSMLTRLEAGEGRSEPNTNPVLPSPAGRLSFSINPIVMANRLLGPKLCRRFAAIVCALLCVWLVIAMLPILLVDIIEHGFGHVARQIFG